MSSRLGRRPCNVGNPLYSSCRKSDWLAVNGTNIGTGQAGNKKGAREKAASEGLAFLQGQHGN